MKTKALFADGGMLLAAILCSTALLASEPAAPVSTNGAPALSETAPVKPASSSKRVSAPSIQFDSQESVAMKRKAALYGINPNLLQAVLIAEFEMGGGKAKQSEAEFGWMVEMSARTLRHCLDEESSLTWALAYYTTGSFDHTKVDDRALRFSSLARKHFQGLEKASPWKPQSNSKQTTKDKE